MTLRQLYNAVLVEINKEEATNLILEDFNYLANKSVYSYMNKRYNIYDINQQTTDDLRVLKATAILEPHHISGSDPYDSEGHTDEWHSFMDATYKVELPSDYFHILNCICVYKVNHDPIGCYDKKFTRFAAKRLTADSWSEVLDNYWNRPTYKRPYYYIHNVNTSAVSPTYPFTFTTDESNKMYKSGTDATVKVKKESETPVTDKLGNNIAEISSGTPTSISLNTTNDDGKDSAKKFSNVERTGQVRYGNVSKVIMEIRYGADNTDFQLFKVLVDYIKTPQHLLLTQSQLDSTSDKSQMLEFPDYVCQEIVNELVTIILENTSNPRLQTQPIVSQSIANPVQQQTPQSAATRAAQQ